MFDYGNLSGRGIDSVSGQGRHNADAYGACLHRGASRDDVGDHGARTMEQLDGLFAGSKVARSDDILDRIDEIVSPGLDVAPPEDAACAPPSVAQAAVRRRPVVARAAARFEAYDDADTMLL